MVEVYLFKSKNFLKKLSDFWSPNNSNYQIYIPEKNVSIGYFSNQELEPSTEKYLRDSSKIEEKKLKQKINNKKFVKKINIEKHSLEALTYSYKTFEVCFKNISKNNKD